jgi:hypothetical protein
VYVIARKGFFWTGRNLFHYNFSLIRIVGDSDKI